MSCFTQQVAAWMKIEWLSPVYSSRFDMLFVFSLTGIAIQPEQDIRDVAPIVDHEQEQPLRTRDFFRLKSRRTERDNGGVDSLSLLTATVWNRRFRICPHRNPDESA